VRIFSESYISVERIKEGSECCEDVFFHHPNHARRCPRGQPLVVHGKWHETAGSWSTYIFPAFSLLRYFRIRKVTVLPYRYRIYESPVAQKVVYRRCYFLLIKCLLLFLHPESNLVRISCLLHPCISFILYCAAPEISTRRQRRGA
jgi:hypothetical protein